MVSEIDTTTPTTREKSAGEGLEAGWVRLGGGIGLLAVVVLLGASTAFGGVGSLNSSSSSAQISSYLGAHEGSILALTVFTVLGAAVGLWFLGTVARIIQARDPNTPLGTIVLAFGVVASAIAAFDGVTLTALVFVHKQGALADPSVVRIFFDLQNGLVMPGLFGFFMAGTLAALGVAMIRRDLAKPWVGWLSAILAALSAVGALTGLSTVNGGTSALGYSPAIGYGIVILITSIYMLRTKREAMPPVYAS